MKSLASKGRIFQKKTTENISEETDEPERLQYLQLQSFKVKKNFFDKTVPEPYLPKWRWTREFAPLDLSSECSQIQTLDIC